MFTRIPSVLHFFVSVFSIPILFAWGQGLPSPGTFFNTTIDDAHIEGIAEDSNGTIYMTINRAVDSSSESWVYKFNADTGEPVRSKLITSGRSKVGACSLTSDESLLVVSPFRADSEDNVGIHGVSTQSLDVVWSNSVARQSSKGVPPSIVPQSASDLIVYCSVMDGIIVLDPTGRMLWSAADVKTTQVAATEESLFTIHPAIGYPVAVYNLSTGVLTGSSGPVAAGATNVGLVVTPDQQSIYTLRTGNNRGLYKSRANFLFFPAKIVTDQIVDATKFGPLISPDGKILYVTNTLDAVTEAYSIPDDRILWRVTLCPTIPLILSHDGISLYSFTCSGDLVRLDALTSDFVWRFSNFPGGFIPSAMALSRNGTRLLLAGTVVTSSSATGYAYVFLTDEDEAIVATESPQDNAPPANGPVSQPTQTLAPSIQDSETVVSSAFSATALFAFSRILVACVLISFHSSIDFR